MRTVPCLVFVAGLVAAPAWGEPRQFSDDFTTAATYDSISLYWSCNSGGSPKYTVLEIILGDFYNEHAVSGGGKLSVSNRQLGETSPLLDCRIEAVIVGVVDLGQDCPDNPDPSPGASLATSEPFTSSELCLYGGHLLSPWQLREARDLDGADNLGGAPGYDDDGDGTTDEFNESLALLAATGNNGYGPPFRGGPDGRPGVAGVDDDGNGLVDDMGESAWTGSDDGDDNQGYLTWLCGMRVDINAQTAIFVNIQPGTFPDWMFSINQLVNLTVSQVEEANELTLGYYRANTPYGFVFCNSGTCYGAAMWQSSDMANPAETIGPVMNSSHSGPVVGFLNQHGVTSSPPRVGGYVRQCRWVGNQNFSDRFWAMSGNPATYYPTPSADLDSDKDVDGFDFLTFSNCYNGSNKPPLTACTNGRADLDRDGDVDGFDFLTFSNCYNGSNRKPLAACFPPNLTTCGS